MERLNELIHLCEVSGFGLDVEPIIAAYKGTAHGSPLRRFVRDCFVCASYSDRHITFHATNIPADFHRDVAAEAIRVRGVNLCETVANVYRVDLKDLSRGDKCHYHQHDDKHPRCVPKPAVADTES